MSKFAALELAVEQPARMTIYHPFKNQPLCDAEGNEAYIDLLSSDSAAAVAFARKTTNQRLSARVRQQMTAEEMEAERTELLATLTKGWRLLGLDGAPIDVPFTFAAARELYATSAMAWLRDQVDAFAASRANFKPASSNS